MDEAGKARKQLTEARPIESEAAGNTNPSWSPDRDRIAYAGSGDSVLQDPAFEEIYAMDADGKNIEQLTKNTVPDFSPDWSNDGKRIVFSRGAVLATETPTASLYVMNADGSDEKKLYPGKGDLLVSPDWSPDGKQVAFTRVAYPTGIPEASVWVINSDGSGVEEDRIRCRRPLLVSGRKAHRHRLRSRQVRQDVFRRLPVQRRDLHDRSRGREPEEADEGQGRGQLADLVARRHADRFRLRPDEPRAGERDLRRRRLRRRGEADHVERRVGPGAGLEVSQALRDDRVDEHEAEERHADDPVHEEERRVEPAQVPRPHERVLVDEQDGDSGDA